MDLPPVNQYVAVFERIIDGDTFAARVNVWPSVYIQASIRVRGINAPETRKGVPGATVCDNEIKAGLIAKERLKQLLNTTSKITITQVGDDKYGGRFLAKVTVNGQDISQILLTEKLVIPYGVEKPWCKN